MEPSVIVVAIAGPIERVGIPALYARFVELLGELPPSCVVLDVAGVDAPDAATIEALARFRLAARRRDTAMRLRGASPRLVELLELAGLQDVLPTDDASGLEPGRQAEERKEVGRVQEEGDPDDPVTGQLDDLE